MTQHDIFDPVTRNAFGFLERGIDEFDKAPNLAKFMAGDFASVMMDEARARLRDIAGEDIADDAFNSFRALADHRNRMIHFFHADVDSDGQAKAQIVAEHCRSCDISDHVERCGWCNEPNTGDMQHSYSTGCSHCDGNVGWEKDD